MSYANMDGVPTQTAGTSELLASDWNTYVRDNFDSIKFGHIVVADATARTNLGNVAEGVMVYQSDNNKVYVNSNGTTANWVEISDLDSTDGVSASGQTALDNVGLVRISTDAFSGSSTVSINNCFSSTYQNYRVVLNFNSNQNSGVGFTMRLRVSGSDATGNDYYLAGTGRTTGGAAITFQQAATSSFQYMYIGGSGLMASFDVIRPFDSARTLLAGDSLGLDSGSGGVTYTHMAFCASHIADASYDGFSLIPGTGTITGTVRVYGYRNG